VLTPLDSNQKFDSLKILVAKDKAFIIGVSEDKKQTIYVIYHDDLSTVKLNKLWSSNNIVKIIVSYDYETQEVQDEKIGLYLIYDNDDCNFVRFV
jgi:hypothetical protein